MTDEEGQEGIDEGVMSAPMQHDLPRLHYKLMRDGGLLELEASGHTIQEAVGGLNYLLKRHQQLTRLERKIKADKPSGLG